MKDSQKIQGVALIEFFWAFEFSPQPQATSTLCGRPHINDLNNVFVY